MCWNKPINHFHEWNRNEAKESYIYIYILCIFLFSKKKSLTDSRLLAYASTICVCDFWRSALWTWFWPHTECLRHTGLGEDLWTRISTLGMRCVCLEHASSNTFGFNSRIHCTRLSASLHFSPTEVKTLWPHQGEQCRRVTHQDLWSCEAYHAWWVISQACQRVLDWRCLAWYSEFDLSESDISDIICGSTCLVVAAAQVARTKEFNEDFCCGDEWGLTGNPTCWNEESWHHPSWVVWILGILGEIYHPWN